MRTIYGLRAQSGRVTWKKEGGSYYPLSFSRNLAIKTSPAPLNPSQFF